MTEPRKITMDNHHTIPFIHQKKISMSRNLGLFIIAVFFACVLATGFLVYSFVGCSCAEKIQEEDLPEVITSTTTSTEATTKSVATEAVLAYKENAEEKEIGKERDQRLPGNIFPSHYDLKLAVFLEEGNFSFKGEVEIFAEFANDSSVIVLNSDELDVNESSLKVMDLDNGRSIPVLEVGKDVERQFLIVHLEETITKGVRCSIWIQYEGLLRDDLQGFYRSSYVENNQTRLQTQTTYLYQFVLNQLFSRWLAATQFQATDARKAFPCFDEPSMKATFKLSIYRPKHMQSISNMPKLKDKQPTDETNR